MDPILELLHFLITLQWEQATKGSQSFVVARCTIDNVPTVVCFSYQKLYPQLSMAEAFVGYAAGARPNQLPKDKPEETWWVRYYDPDEWDSRYITGKHRYELCSRNLSDSYHPAFREAYGIAYSMSQLWTARKMLGPMPETDFKL